MKTKKKLAPTPTMRPGTYTADQVLAWVARRVAEEPKRMSMDTWIAYYKGDQVQGRKGQPKPACGTVACLAGWINIGTKQYDSENECNYGPGTALDALDLSGQAREDLYGLFLHTSLKPNEVLKELARIRQEHAEELKSTKVVVEGRKR